MKLRPIRRRQKGQTLIFMAMVLVAIAIIGLWNFDLHKILNVKSKTRNGGDAAALAGARWQATTLNTIGNLNVMQAVAITEALSRGETDFPEAEAIANLAKRVNIVGPMTGYAAAQQAAKNNGIFNNEEFADDLWEHARLVRQNYPIAFPDPYPPTASGSAWEDYAEMIETIAAGGMAMYCENPNYFVDYTGPHTLLNPSFYDAIYSRDWCWFLHNEHDLLQTYSNWREWPDLPQTTQLNPINSEFFSTKLTRAVTIESLPVVRRGDASAEEIIDMMSELAETTIHPTVAVVEATWHVYGGRWGSWDATIPEGFPWEGDIKAQYDYTGADSATRIETQTTRVSPGAIADDVTWTAAAKPFGHLESDEGEVKPNAYDMVLPAFREVRLVPIDASSAPAGGSRPGWVPHIYQHLPIYMNSGLRHIPHSCYYCNQLRTWEVAAFREEGREWLRVNSASCYTPPGGGGGGGGGGSGGTRRPH